MSTEKTINSSFKPLIEELSTKRPYQPPQLSVYGNIHELTLNINSARPTADSNPSGNKKTS